ncbi:MAG TPA: DUF1648 domain-containing protein [Blastocatellia bacterium]|jgi:uncharacterized membrane protein|nr:DUF1648 domain-containing protein [Blastocatellia bacterium]
MTEAKRETRNAWLRLAPFVVLSTAAAILALRWQSLPERWIVHWGPGGVPDRWVTKDPFIVFIPLVAGLVLCAIFEVLATAISKRRHVASHIKASPEAAAQMAAVIGDLVRMIALALAVLFTLLSLALPIFRPQSPGSMVITSLVLMLVVIVIGVVRFKRTASALQSRGLIQAPDGWSALIYRNPGDSRLIVPKAFSPGYTINYAHPWAWPVTLFLIGLPLLVVVIVWKAL